MKATIKILQWTHEVIHPKVLINSQISSEDLVKLETGFLNQLKDYKEVVFGRTKLSRRCNLSQLRKLVNISNTIYGYLFRLSPVWKRKASSSSLRKVYLHLLVYIEKIINIIGHIEPQAYSKIPLTRYRISCMKMRVKETVSRFLHILYQSQIDQELYHLLERDLYLFLANREITRAEMDYIINLIKHIEISSVTDKTQLMDILYLHGFNAKDFFYFYSNELNNRLKAVPNLHGQIQIIIDEQDRLNGLPGSKARMFPYLAPIDGQLKNFLSKKERHLTEILNLRRAVIQDEQSMKSTSRQKIFLSVPQFSLLIRLFIEKGLLANENIGELFTFFATHFSTPQTQFISADSLRKKSTDVEFATAQKLKGHLIEMLNWLNENYNLSNYKKS
jgi:hypothetical protein